MGTAWSNATSYPWEDPSYVGGIDNIKILMSLRIYGNKWHVYGGLAIMNPSAQIQIDQYGTIIFFQLLLKAKSVSELFKLMIQEKHQDFRKRILVVKNVIFIFFDTFKAGAYVFRDTGDTGKKILLDDDLLEQFSLSSLPKTGSRKPVLSLF